eukprot:356868-Chlamydomonas_euryale.AAC.19
MLTHARNVRSAAKKVLGSTRLRTRLRAEGSSWAVTSGTASPGSAPPPRPPALPLLPACRAHCMNFGSFHCEMLAPKAEPSAWKAPWDTSIRLSSLHFGPLLPQPDSRSPCDPRSTGKDIPAPLLPWEMPGRGCPWP